MRMGTFHTSRDSYLKKGNVLFLILIAVALFGALSFAIVSTTRGGAGDTQKDTIKIQAGELSGYLASIASAYQRYYMTSGTSKVASGISNGLCNSASGNCFWYNNPSLPKSIKSNKVTYSLNAVGTNENRGVEGIGTTVGDEVIWLQGVPDNVCTEINKALGISGIPSNTTAYPTARITSTPYQISACTKNPDGTTIYYYVLLPG